MTVEQIKVWCADNNVFYLKANIKLPKGIYEEADALYKSGFFIPHRDSHGRNWEVSTLRGEEWNVTTYDKSKRDNYKWTEVADRTPIMTKWLKETFPSNLHTLGRCRFMLLKPGGFIRSHTDTHKWEDGMPLKNDILSAINISINQPDNCYLRRTEDCLEVPFTPGSVFWFNNGAFHEAANFSKDNRYHFIIHGGANIERNQLFIDSFMKEYPDAVI